MPALPQKRLVRVSDIILAAFIIAITAMLLVPLPTPLLDVLLVINIAFSILLLLAGLYMPNALALLSFPSILLLTTLFRLGLNVASARLILSQGNAGSVIQAFGTFLIRGEIVVGLIIFLILTVVNFIVVARGAARVSEVAARFALDALPGKQMAIDSDLRAGLINAPEAQRRREDLRKESSLYGAMDGAMKFVQGDVIAGLFIIGTNILGGLYMGLQSGLSLSDAVNTYTVLTVGDGLVHQIPAILISICAGIVVTRVSSGEGASLGSDLQAQVFTRPGTLLFCGVLLVLVGATPGLPALPFMTVGLSLCAIGIWYWRRSGEGSATGTSLALSGMVSLSGNQHPPLGLSGREDEAEDVNDNLIILLDGQQLHPQFMEERVSFFRWWRQFSLDVFSETGLSLPVPTVRLDSSALISRFAIVVRHSTVDEGEIPPNCLAMEINPLNANAFGVDVIAELFHPFDGSTICWVSNSDGAIEIAEAAGVRFWTPLQYIAQRVGAFYCRAPEEALAIAEVLELENQLEEKFPGLITRTLNREFFGASRLAELLQELVREGVNVRDTKQIVEAAASYCSSLGPSRMQEGDFDLEDAVSFVRQTRRRHLVARHLSARRSLKVITLSRSLEDALEETAAVRSNGPAVPLAPEAAASARRSLERVIEPVYSRGTGQAVILCRPDLRSRVINFLRQYGSRVAVLTFDELDPMIPVEPVGAWGVG